MGCSFKDKKDITIAEFLGESNCKLNKILVNKGSEIYNDSIKSCNKTMI